MHIYAFGSVCRGEVFSDSDIDLLVVTNSEQESFTHDAYSIYSYERIKEIWDDGNPFAWHLSLESKLIFSSDGDDFIKELKHPRKYNNYAADSKKFHTLLMDSSAQLKKGSSSIAFELSNLFLSIRNISICYSLAKLEKPVFSRAAAMLLEEDSVPIPL